MSSNFDAVEYYVSERTGVSDPKKKGGLISTSMLCGDGDGEGRGGAGRPPHYTSNSSLPITPTDLRPAAMGVIKLQLHRNNANLGDGTRGVHSGLTVPPATCENKERECSAHEGRRAWCSDTTLRGRGGGSRGCGSSRGCGCSRSREWAGSRGVW